MSKPRRRGKVAAAMATNKEQQTPIRDIDSVQLEIIACSLEDALAAYEGGASSLEVCVQLDQAGLTPPLSLVREIVQRVPIPVRIMLRERDDFVLSGPEELATLQKCARDFSALGVDGLVVGHIKEGRLDTDALRAVISAVPTKRFTVHHAVEKTADPRATLQTLRAFAAVDRALVHGGTGTLQERSRRLLMYKDDFGNGQQLIAGGGLTLEMLRPLREATGIQIFHLGRAVRTPEESSGKVDAHKIRRAWTMLTAEAGEASSL